MNTTPEILTCKRCKAALAFLYPDRLEVGGAAVRERVRLECSRCHYVTRWCPPGEKPADGIDRPAPPA